MSNESTVPVNAADSDEELDTTNRGDSSRSVAAPKGIVEEGRKDAEGVAIVQPEGDSSDKSGEFQTPSTCRNRDRESGLNSTMLDGLSAGSTSAMLQSLAEYMRYHGFNVTAQTEGVAENMVSGERSNQSGVTKPTLVPPTSNQFSWSGVTKPTPIELPGSVAQPVAENLHAANMSDRSGVTKPTSIPHELSGASNHMGDVRQSGVTKPTLCHSPECQISWSGDTKPTPTDLVGPSQPTTVYGAHSLLDRSGVTKPTSFPQQPNRLPNVAEVSLIQSLLASMNQSGVTKPTLVPPADCALSWSGVTKPTPTHLHAGNVSQPTTMLSSQVEMLSGRSGVTKPTSLPQQASGESNFAHSMMSQPSFDGMNQSGVTKPTLVPSADGLLSWSGVTKPTPLQQHVGEFNQFAGMMSSQRETSSNQPVQTHGTTSVVPPYPEHQMNYGIDGVHPAMGSRPTEYFRGYRHDEPPFQSSCADAIQRSLYLQKMSDIYTGHGQTPSFREKEPPIFDGEMPWDEYRRLFEYISIANRWDDTQMAIGLMTHLRGSALTTVQILSTPECFNYRSLVTTLERRYGSSHARELNGVKLRSRFQEKNEDLAKFAAEVIRLAQLAFPNDSRETQQRIAQWQFIDGIYDDKLRDRVRMARPREMNDALHIALEFDALQKANSFGYHRIRVVNEVETPEPPPTVREDPPRRPRTRRRRRGGNATPVGAPSSATTAPTQSSTPTTTGN